MALFGKKKQSSQGDAAKPDELADQTPADEETIDEAHDDSGRTVETTLSLHPEAEIPEEDEYYLRFLNGEAPRLKPGQVALSGISAQRDENGLMLVTAFIRNGAEKAIRLKQSTVLLMSNDNQVIAKKQVDLSGVGDIPPRSARPWNFYFAPKEQLQQEFPKDGWKIGFHVEKPKREHHLDLADSWKNALSEQQVDKLKDMIRDMKPPRPGEVNFMGMRAVQSENGDLHVTLLIRNGGNNELKLDNVPLQVEDAHEEVIARGGFKLDNFAVQPFSSRPWTFVFPHRLLKKEEIDLSKWRAYPIKKKQDEENA